MKIGFTGTRQPLEFHQKKKVESVLETLLDSMTYAITGACKGVDSFVAHWLHSNSDVQQIIVVPSRKDIVDTTVYGISRAAMIEMPNEGYDRVNSAASYRRRNEKIVELCDRLVAFYKGNPQSGTKMTMNIAERAGILSPSDIHKI